jgi:hypothetical protein
LLRNLLLPDALGFRRLILFFLDSGLAHHCGGCAAHGCGSRGDSSGY